MKITHPNDMINDFIFPLWNQKSLEVIDRFVSPHADIQTTFFSGQGPEILRKSAVDIFSAFPHFSIQIADLIEMGSQLIYRWEACARHEGTIIGIPKTGQDMLFKGLFFGKVQDGLLSQYHSFSNMIQVLRNTCAKLDRDPKAHLQIELCKLTELPLTRREIECLSLWLRGGSIKETAKQMGGISTRTIQTYRESIKKKFNVETFQELFSLIQRGGVMPLFLEIEHVIGVAGLLPSFKMNVSIHNI